MGYEFERYYVVKTNIIASAVGNGNYYVVIPENATLTQLTVLITDVAADTSTITLYDAYSGGNTLATISIATTDTAGTIKTASLTSNITANTTLRVNVNDPGGTPTLKVVVQISYKTKF